MTWEKIWILFFGTTEWLGLDMGFWVSMGVVTLLVVIMNVVFWGMKPRNNVISNKSKNTEYDQNNASNLFF